MPSTTRPLIRLVAVAALALVGCAGRAPPTTAPGAGSPPGGGPTDEVAAERAKLTPEDRALVDAQEWCVVSPDERLGSMGPPLKLILKGQPVFVCCKGCVRQAEANPDRTLTAATELKAKAKAERTKVGAP